MSKLNKNLKLVVKQGAIYAIYDDALTALFDGADVKIERASHVEPYGLTRKETGHWCADLSPVDGPMLVGFNTRQEALDAEREYLDRYVIT